MCSLLNVNVNVCNEHVVTVLNVFKQLKGRSTFYQAVLTFLSHNYADKREIQVLKKVFFSIDCDVDGRISKEELQCAYDKWNVSVDQEEVDMIFENVDLDKNGYIEYEEFIRAALANTEDLFCDINLKAAFDVFDLDKNGIITLKELTEVLGVDTNENNAEMLRRSVFKEGIEGVTFEHFKEIMLLK
jgi:Ca2+-binding EF-hand superfamily protein